MVLLTQGIQIQQSVLCASILILQRSSDCF